MESDYKEIENLSSSFKVNIVFYKIIFNFLSLPVISYIYAVGNIK